MVLTDDPTARNPWLELPSAAPYVLSSDRPFVEAFNKHASEANQFDLGVPPEPFIGNRGAPLIVLGLNPGRTEWDSENYMTPERLDAVLANLGDDPERQVHYALTEAFAGAPVGRWWRRRVNQLVLAGPPLGHLARSMLAIEFHGYHSQSFEPIPITLPSQWFGFSLVEQAIARGATVVMTRGGRQWTVAVPALMAYERVVSLRSRQEAAISPKDCGDQGWEMILDALASAPGH